MSNDKNYEVGYCKPPKHSQFKKGQSGNQKGRPKDPLSQIEEKSLYEIIAKESSQEIKVREGDKVFTLTKREAIVRSLINAAIKGNLQAARIAINDLKIIDSNHLSEYARKKDAKSLEAYAMFEQSSIAGIDAFIEVIAEIQSNPANVQQPIKRHR